MKISLRVLAIGAVVLSGCVSPESAIKSDSVTALQQLDQERIQAQVGADAAALDRLYAEDFIGIGPSGTVRTKAQVIADFTSGSLRFQSITTDDVQWRLYGDTAVETGRSTRASWTSGSCVGADQREAAELSIGLSDLQIRDRLERRPSPEISRPPAGGPEGPRSRESEGRSAEQDGRPPASTMPIGLWRVNRWRII